MNTNSFATGLTGLAASLVTATGLTWSPEAQAQDLPLPQFREDQHVYCVPRCDFSTTELEANLDGRDYPFYSVLYPHVEDTRRGNMQDQVHAIVDEWSYAEGFDKNYATVIGFSGLDTENDRDIFMLPGGKLRTTFKFNPSREQQFWIDDLKPRMFAQDWTGALNEYTLSLDMYYREIAKMPYQERVEADERLASIKTGALCLMLSMAALVLWQTVKGPRNGKSGDTIFTSSGHYSSGNTPDSGGSSHHA